MDKISKAKRSWNMSRIKSAHTTPELFVRSLLHRAGYRFRLHVKNLPGKPDIVLPKYKTVIEVRGCFWHQHSKCSKAAIPATRSDWWEDKLLSNVRRDQTNVASLQSAGWKVIVIWGCLIKKAFKDSLLAKVILEKLELCFWSNITFADINDMLKSKELATE
jgi:DNA mismatch endonuclease (patch repair protein)